METLNVTMRFGVYLYTILEISWGSMRATQCCILGSYCGETSVVPHHNSEEVSSQYKIGISY